MKNAHMLHKSPKATSKPDISGVYTKNSSTSQSRIKERLTSSPLKIPLQKAIRKTLQRDISTDRQSQSRILTKSKIKQESRIVTSRIISRNLYKEDPDSVLEKMHPQTNQFLKKYFNLRTTQIMTESFIQAIMREYEKLWGAENSLRVFDFFTYKMYEMFGESLSTQQLVRLTSEDGMIGLILQILKQIKNESQFQRSTTSSRIQNPNINSLKQSFQQKLATNVNLDQIKNVVQEFMETMYQCMEGQIYEKFNVQMRRMVVKYRQAERIMRKVTEKITAHADIFDLQNHFKTKKKQLQQKIENLSRENQKLITEMQRQRNNLQIEKKQVWRLNEENYRLKANLQKYQHVVLTKVLDTNNYGDQTMSRRVSCGPLSCEKQNNMRISQINQQPFKITIDTIITQKDGEPPETKTIATLQNPNQDIENRPIDNSMVCRNEMPLSEYGRLSHSTFRRPE